ncbi:MAG TPA: agmatinase [Candidatus Dormibacteraeota bacterium]|nr:agmatinase [Candidatus Dormibacteraeota bacterium]
MGENRDDVIGPVDPQKMPRFAGPTTFARLPAMEGVGKAEVAIIGIPFDSGVVYRPGARFGPAAIRAGSRMLRPFNAWTGAEPFARQVVDAGDIACTPFSIEQAIGEIEAGAKSTYERAAHVLALGGDHTVALPLLRAAAAKFGPLALVHFDAHLDTWNTYFGGARYTHGTPFRRAAEEGLLDLRRSIHIGTRGPQFSAEDLRSDSALGFRMIDGRAIDDRGAASIAAEIRELVGEAHVYLSFDIDLLDPAFAPATGTPEAGGWSSREAIAVLRELAGIRLAAADVVEVAPAYDHAEVTAIAAANITFETLCLFGL